MANKFARKKFYSIETVGGVEQLDYLSFQWIKFNKFLQNREINQTTITERTAGRLELVADDFYGNVFLWWIIALANNILDPINDVTIGKTLIIPTLSDVESFFQSIISKRQQKGEVLLPRIEV